MASDVASQGGGAGPGRDRHRRARSAVRAGWRGGPSPGPRAVIGARPGGTSRRAAATAAQGSKREAHLRLIWQFHRRISASFADRQVRQWASLEAEGPPEPIGQSRAATRPRPAELCQSEMGSRKGLGNPSEPDPSDSEVYRSRPGHQRQIRPGRPGSSQRQRGVLRACEPPGVLTRC